MVYFSNEIISQIKTAIDSGHLNSIIEKSIQTPSSKNRMFSSERKYLMNMVMALRYEKAKELDAKRLENLSHAIDIFERLRKQKHSDFF
jgi:hypothetical protein